MKVLGLDISEKSTGWAVLTDRLTLMDYGAISFTSTKSMKEMLLLFSSVLTDIIEKHKPFDYIIIEDTFFQKNVKTLKTLCMFAGVALVTCSKNSPDTTIGFIMPTSARSALWPKQKVDKQQVFVYISDKYQLKNIPNDVTDAIALASFPFLRKLEERWIK